MASSTIDELRAFVDAAWRPDASLLEWRRALFDAGWAAPSLPRADGGRDLGAADAEAVAETLAALGVPGPPDGVGLNLAVPVLVAHGDEDLRRSLVRPTVTGAVVWCQLFSEPGAGSDLAGLTTTARRDGDEWVVDGQKVWNTGAATADLGLLVARTDWDVPKHRGLSAFVLPMRQPGVEVRPLRQMNGHASFNEVFLTSARIPAAHLLAEEGAGWAVAQTTLMHERRLAARRRQGERRDPTGRVWREAVAEATAAAEPHKWYPQRAGRPDLLVERARNAGRAADPLVRQAVAATLARSTVAGSTSRRAAAARAAGRPPGPEGSLGKLATSVIARQAAAAHALVAGAAGLLAGDDAPDGGVVAEILVSVPAQSIAGGTDEIQHNILGERVLGLPREPSVDRDLPFREVRRA
ncbi:MAG TPA: acyl-CoA dehydrogenase family protein [Acidimicrobiales bacterium]|nr:acyl-CoA dehydrogenase family protein [Acidimicrobiales bacterium]